MFAEKVQKFIIWSYQVPIDIMSQLMGNSQHPSPHQVCLQLTTALMKIVQLCNLHQVDADDDMMMPLSRRFSKDDRVMRSS